MSQVSILDYLPDISQATQRLFRPLTFHPGDVLHVDVDLEARNFVISIRNHLRHYPSREASYEWIGRVPEKKRLDGDNVWLVGGTDISVLFIHLLWPAENLEFTDDAKLKYQYILTRVANQARLARIKAQKKPLLEFIDNEEFPLSSYQRLALETCMNQEGAALFMEQGTGKTPIVIARICNESLKCDHQYRVLIICPKNACSNWRNELSRFTTNQGKVAILRGGALNRLKLIIEATQLDESKWAAIVSSYESAVRTMDAIRLIEWDLVVLDESHYIKSVGADRTKKLLAFRERAKQRMCLTGTPICNGLLDVYSQLEFCGEGYSGFQNWRNFKYFHGSYIQEGRFEKLVGYQNVPFLQERLARIAFIIRKEEALPELPEKMYDVYDVEMTPEQATYYKKVQTELALEIQNDLDSAGPNKMMVINNVLTKLLRLAQITSGFLTWGAVIGLEGEEIEPKQIDRLDPNPKLEALVEILKEKSPEDKTIVWSCWVQDIKTIKARLEVEGIDAVTYYGGTSEQDRIKAVERFNCDPNCKVFIGNPTAGGTAINLHGYDIADPNSKTNCTHVIYFSQNWSMSSRSQSEDRCHRIGTRTNIRYTDLVCPDTIDEQIRMRVLRKKQVAYLVQDLTDILAIVLKKVDISDDE